MTNLFSKIETTPRMELTETEEQGAIAEARLGDNDAAMQLLANYLPLMKSLVGQAVRRASTTDTAQNRTTLNEELQSAAMEGFFDAVRDYDRSMSPRLGAVLKVNLQRVLYSEVGQNVVLRVPPTIRQRFKGILEAAEGDRALARELAPTMGLATSTYDAVARAYQIGASPDATMVAGEVTNERAYDPEGGGTGVETLLDGLHVAPLGGHQPLVYVETVHTANRALDALDPTARLVVEALYGIGGEVQTEREAAEKLGIPRSTLQRVHKRALATMHSRIA